jgi:trehalose/maltose hydrolase-like predicted phosphorylase
VNLWHISEDTFHPDLKMIHSQESVFTIGNGYFCTRGTFEEGYPRDMTATLLYGVFDAIPIAKEELANIPARSGNHLELSSLAEYAGRRATPHCTLEKSSWRAYPRP